jgi:hypothetical protein
MTYEKPTLASVGQAAALVLGDFVGRNDNQLETSPTPKAIGLDD